MLGDIHSLLSEIGKRFVVDHIMPRKLRIFDGLRQIRRICARELECLCYVVDLLQRIILIALEGTVHWRLVMNVVLSLS